MLSWVYLCIYYCTNTINRDPLNRGNDVLLLLLLLLSYAAQSYIRVRQTFIPRPYIYITLLSFYHTSLNRLCSVRSESHIKHLFVCCMGAEGNKDFHCFTPRPIKNQEFYPRPWLRRILNKREGKWMPALLLACHTCSVTEEHNFNCWMDIDFVQKFICLNLVCN